MVWRTLPEQETADTEGLGFGTGRAVVLKLAVIELGNEPEPAADVVVDADCP